MELSAEHTRRKFLDRQVATFFDLPFALAADPVITGSILWCPFHEILDPARKNSPTTDADRFGLMKIDLKGPPYDLKVVNLPLIFPPEPSGQKEAKRVTQIRGVSGDEIYVAVISPYLRHGVRGVDNFLYSFNTKNLTWYRWSRLADFRLERATLAAGKLPVEFSEENPENALCIGSMILTFGLDGEPRLHIDTTPHQAKEDERDPMIDEASREEREQKALWGLRNLDRIKVRDWVENLERLPSSVRWTAFETNDTSYEIQNPRAFLSFASDRIRTAGVSSLKSVGNFCISIAGRERLAVFLRVAGDRRGRGVNTVIDSMLLTDL